MSTSKKYKTKSFATVNNNIKVRMNSSSGGAFYTIAKKVIEDGGVVFGAAFDNDGQVCHKACVDLESVKKLMQSKYVQSSVGNAYGDVREFLSKGQKVLFTGTPCQVYGLLSFIGYSMGSVAYKNLITVDFVCHGVPSRLVWRKYLKEVSGERTHVSINFRDKTNGWRDFSLKIQFDDGSHYLRSWHKDPYVQGFIKNLYLRESCYQCQFRGVDRESDFTIADFWGVHKYLPEMFDDKGTSIIMAHNDRAVEMLENLKSDLQLHEITNELVVQTNSPVVKSVERHSKRGNFFETLSGDKTIGAQITSFIKMPFAKRIIRKIFK